MHFVHFNYIKFSIYYDVVLTFATWNSRKADKPRSGKRDTELINKRFILTTFTGCLLLMTLAACALSLVIVKAHDDAIEEAKSNASDIAAIMAEQISNATDALAIALGGVAARIDTRSATGFAQHAKSREFSETLGDLLKTVPLASAFAIHDADGAMLVASSAWPAPTVAFPDAEVFAQLKAGRGNDIAVGKPFPNPKSGGGTIAFFRRLETPAGEFLGVAAIGAEPDVFARMPATLSGINGKSFALLRSDGVVLLDRTAGLDRTVLLEKGGPQWKDAMAKGGGVFFSEGPNTDIRHFSAVRPLARHPMAMSFLITEVSALEGWRTRAAILCIVGLIVLTSVGLMLAAFLWHSRTGLSCWPPPIRLPGGSAAFCGHPISGAAA